MMSIAVKQISVKMMDKLGLGIDNNLQGLDRFDSNFFDPLSSI